MAPEFLHTTMADRSAALLEHIVSRVEQDVQFLVDHNYISAQDAAIIVARLPNSAAVQAPVQAAAPVRMPVASPPPTYPGAQASVCRARALWGYNEHGNVGPSGYACQDNGIERVSVTAGCQRSVIPPRGCH